MDKVLLQMENDYAAQDKWHSYAPVSYTHLDVYKRQIYHKLALEQMGDKTIDKPRPSCFTTA